MVLKNNIALITDFGTKDWFSGSVQGIILKINPDASIINVSHNIPNHSIEHAAFFLKEIYNDFPENTIFGVIVDPGVGTERKILFFDMEQYKFIVPDNGIISYVLNDFSSFKVYQINYPVVSKSNTFHGRDIFAPFLAEYSLKRDVLKYCYPIENFLRKTFPQISEKENEIFGEIVYSDHFGNLFTNITKKDIDINEIDHLEINRRKISFVSDNYSGIPNHPFLIWNSSNFLEIAFNSKNAEKILNAGIGTAFKIIMK